MFGKNEKTTFFLYTDYLTIQKGAVDASNESNWSVHSGSFKKILYRDNNNNRAC